MNQIIPCVSDWKFSRDGVDWQNVSLPHSVFVEPETIVKPQVGRAIYQYRFSAPEEWKRKIVSFEIGAAMQRAEVYVNGEYHFTHFGGYQKFFIPLTDDLKDENLIEIHLDNADSRDMPPGKIISTMDFCYHSGLYRDAKLHVWEPVHITDPLAVSIPAGGGVFLRTEQLNPDGSAEISASCHVIHEMPATRRFEILQLAKEPNQVSVKLQITAPDGTCVFETESDSVEIRPNTDHTFRFKAKIANAALWTPEAPARYTAAFLVTHDGKTVHSMQEKIGIRTIEFTKDGFYLNGVRTFLNGTNRHMEYPFIGNAVPENGQWRDAMLIKKSGYNFVRLSHYNQDPAFHEACDSLGLLVMAAIPGWQAYHSNSAFIENSFRDCRELIRCLRNRPSIILWELSLNEAYPPAWVNTEFCRITHEEYPGSQCYSAGDTWGFSEMWDVLFPCGHQRSTEKPVLLREYGDWCFGGGNSTSRRTRGDSMKERLIQCWNFMWTYNRLQAVPCMVGAADWCFFDYNRGCSSNIETSGSMDVYRQPKIKFFFYQSQGEEPMLYPVHDEKDKLIVFTNCDEIEVEQSGKLIVPRRKPDDGPDTPYNLSLESSPDWETALPDCGDTSGGNPFDGGNCKQLTHPPFTCFGVPAPEAGSPLVIRGYKDGKQMFEQTLQKPEEVVEVETLVREDGVPVTAGDLVFVDAILKDRNGTPVPENVPVRLNVSGGAEIIGGMPETVAGIASWLVRVTDPDFQAVAERI